MKKISLMFLVSTILYLIFTFIISIIIDPMIYVDDALKWQGQLWMVGNMCLTMVVTWLVFSKAFSSMIPSIFITIIAINFCVVILDAVSGDFSISHTLLVLTSLFTFISIFKIVNKEVTM